MKWPLYLVRHGETVWNAEGRVQGHLDSPLTSKGLLQGDKVGLRLAAELRGAWSTMEGQVSPLGRAKQTAARIAKFTPLAFKDEPRLMEVTMGSWDGLTLEEIDIEYPDALVGAGRDDWQFRSPDGENFAAAQNRVRSWLGSLSAPTVAISHGLTIRLIRAAYLGLTGRDLLGSPIPQDGFLVLENGEARFVA